MKITKKVTKAMATLQVAYKSGLIDYPRVDNNFIASSSYDLFPHAQMNKIGPFLNPIKEGNIVIDKSSSILCLTMARTLQPSTIVDSAKLIDEFFDDDLNFSSTKKEKDFNSIVSIFESYCASNNLKDNDFAKILSDFSKKSRISCQSLLLFEADDIRFVDNGDKIGLAPAPSLHRSAAKFTRNKKKTEEKYLGSAIELEKTRKEASPSMKASDGLSLYKERFLELVRLEEQRRGFSAQANALIKAQREINSAILGTD